MLILAPVGYVTLLLLEAIGLWLRQAVCFHRFAFERLVPSLTVAPFVQLRCVKCHKFTQRCEVIP